MKRLFFLPVLVAGSEKADFIHFFLYVKQCEAWVLACKLLSDVLVFVRVSVILRFIIFLIIIICSVYSLFLKRTIIIT